MSRNPEVTRFWKYVFLATVGAVFTFVVFNAFSFYAARRDLDNELKSASIPSLEWLYQVQRNNNALAIASLETRCTERMQLAAFRLLQSDDAGLLIDAYDRQFNARIALIQLLSSGAGVIDTRKALTYFDNLQSNVLYIDSYLAPAAGVSISSEAYLEFRRKVIDWQKHYRIIQADLQSAKDVATDAKYKAIFNNTNNAIQALESRLVRISAATIKLDDTQREVFMRYSMWTESLIGSIPVQLLNEYSTAPNAKSNELPLKELDCRALEQAFRLYTGIDLRLSTSQEKVRLGRVAELDGLVIPSYSLYDRARVTLFTLPPVAQTLLVTLLLGALGAITLNMLRLSRFGWWGARNDPTWGEVLVGPFLGGVAAFVVFLTASTGLLLTTGATAQAGSTPLSAFFVGLLGFLSGLLYDEAFAQVRRVGANYFGNQQATGVGQTDADREFARILDEAKLPILANLSLAAGLGEQLASAAEFTLFAPPDSALPRELLEAWAKAGHGVPEIQAWFDAHLSSTKLDMTNLTTISQSIDANVVMRNGAKKALTLDNNTLKVAGAAVASSDIRWRNGLLHLLSGEFG